MSAPPPNDPIYSDLVQRIEACVGKRRDRALCVGLSGSQGSGKSTLALVLQALLRERRLSTAIVSLDDLYLSLASREGLARTVHPLLRTRGVPGTHEVALGLRVLADLKAGKAVSLPSFDKAADDRRPERDWTPIQASVNVVIFEGWCVGAVPQKDADLIRPVNSLESEEDRTGAWRQYVNDALATGYRALFDEIDMLVLLAAPSFDVVYSWRLEQEHELRRRVAEQGADASRLMSDRALHRFVSHYERLTRHILEEMPARADIVVRLDAKRRGTIEHRAE